MWLGVLGPLRVRDGSRDLPVPAPKQRVLLAALLLHANHVVSFDELAETLWTGAPTPGAHVTVRNYVRRLRQVLGPQVGARIVTRDPGYFIEVGDDELDLLLFRRLCRESGLGARARRWPQVADIADEALGLWRGTPLADVPSQMLQRDEVPPLIQARLQVVEWRFDAALHLGRHAEVVTELESASAKHPLHEPLHAQLMLALYRCGRQADALAVYRRARRTLRDEIGVEPGPELRQLHDRILRADAGLSAPSEHVPGPPAGSQSGNRDAVVPRQLPADPAHFTGRTAELTELTKVLSQSGLTSARVIAVIGGTPGVGKTTLAVHWAHATADRFPDGQLYVNLGGFDLAITPLSTAEAIRGFLDALGVPPQRIPPGTDEQASLYRSLLASKRMLIVLDNARDEQQVRPLLPGGPGCQVVVTSRNDLLGLVASHGAHRLSIDVLSDEEARELLTRHLGAERLAAEPGVPEEIIAHCARLPLALAIAAARAAAGPLPLKDLAGELADSMSRLDALDLSDTAMNVRNVFGWSYRALSSDAARMFRLLGISSGPDITANAAASLLDASIHEARRLLRELTSACLLAEHVPGRFTCHDLLRAYATEIALGEDSEADRRSALRRLLDYYLQSASSAALCLNPARHPIALESPQPGAAIEPLADKNAALAWLDAERTALLAAIALAPEHGFYSHAWQLAWALADYFSQHGHWSLWLTAQRTALEAAQHSGDRIGQAVAWRHLGQAAASTGDNHSAREHLQQAILLFDELGDLTRLCASHHDLARICVQEGDISEALNHARQSLDLARIDGQQAFVATALNAVGWCLAQLGDHRQALAMCEEALLLHREVGNVAGEANTLDSIGYIHYSLGQHTEAIDYFRRALDELIGIGNRWLQANTLNRMGDAYLAAGSHTAAGKAWLESVTIMDELHHPDITAVRAKLDSAASGGPG